MVSKKGLAILIAYSSPDGFLAAPVARFLGERSFGGALRRSRLVAVPFTPKGADSAGARYGDSCAA